MYLCVAHCEDFAKQPRWKDELAREALAGLHRSVRQKRALLRFLDGHWLVRQAREGELDTMTECKHEWKVSKTVEAKCSLCGMLLSEAIRLRDESNTALKWLNGDDLERRIREILKDEIAKMDLCQGCRCKGDV